MPGTFDFIEGFDYYPANVGLPGLGVLSTWIQGFSVIAGDYSLPAGRFLPGRSFRIQPGPSINWVTRAIPPGTKKAIGFAVKFEALGIQPDGFGKVFLQILDIDGNTQYTVSVNVLGEIRMQNAKTGEIGLASGRRVLNNTWHYLELLIHHQEQGRMNLFIDGMEQFDLAGNYLPAPTNQIGRLRLWTTNGSSVFLVDDMYCLDGADEVLGECRIQMLEPSMDSQVEWTGNPGGGNFANVDDPNVDSDTTYNYSNTVGAKDYFKSTQIEVNPSVIHAIGTVLAARKEDSGTRTIRSKVRSGGVEGNGHNENLTTDYIWSRDIYTLDPQGNVPWTKARVNNLDIGYELVL